MRKVAGFTLIEILVAATIIAVLVSIGIVSYGSINKRSRDSKRKSDVEQLRSALEMYRADNGYYPGSSTSWINADDLAAELVPTYIPLLSADPTATAVYRYQAANGSGTPTRYYGYCLSAYLETENPTDSCTPDTASGHNYGAKNP